MPKIYDIIIMKKLLIKLVFVGMFIFGFAFVSNALICSTIYVECENGNSGAGLACGEDYVEMFLEWVELSDAICNPD
ncbi:MAG: hypothetical protein L3J54_04310 [Draconibacterium sp.]|nr:hypothetical protein [Draconibacterium sp.]